MARLPRMIIAGQPQHVIVRGNQWGQTRLIYEQNPAILLTEFHFRKSLWHVFQE